MTLPAPQANGARALRRIDVKRLYGVSLSTVDRRVSEGAIRSRRVGRALLLHAGDVEREFGWPEDAEIEPSRESRREIAELLA